MLLAALLLAAAAPPAASDPPAAPLEDLKSVVVKAIRNCGLANGDEITVCAKDRGFAEGYRLPKISPRYSDAGHPPGKLEALEGAGSAGQGSCTMVGAAGTTGCTLAQAKAWAEWKKRQKAREESVFPW